MPSLFIIGALILYVGGMYALLSELMPQRAPPDAFDCNLFFEARSSALHHQVPQPGPRIQDKHMCSPFLLASAHVLSFPPRFSFSQSSCAGAPLWVAVAAAHSKR